MKISRNLFALLVIAGFAFLLAPASPSQANFTPSTAPATAEVGKKAPDFSLPGVNGNTVALSKLKGKVVLINYWATWCGPCVSELPDLNAIYKEFQPQGLEMIGISMDDSADTVKGFTKGTPINYTVAMGNDKVAGNYGGNTLPRTYLVDRQGRIRQEYNRRIDKQQVITQVKALLAEK